MRLTGAQLAQLISHARRESPNEACGLIAGKEDQAVTIYPLTNVEPDARYRYLGDPNEQLNAFREMDDRQLELLAIYHSHPATEAFPSATDIARAFYPEATYLLISLMNPEQATVRGFTIKEGRVKEITLEVENEPSRENSRRTAKRAGGPGPSRTVAALSKRRPSRGGIGQWRGRVSKQV